MVTRVPTRMITTTGVQAGSYTAADITVNEAGQITGAASNSVVVSGGGGGPKITGVTVTDNAWTVLDDTAVDVLGGYIKITGSGFNTGCLVYINQTLATATTYISSTEVRAQLPATAAGTYALYLVNSDGGVGIRLPGVTFSASPSWQTSSSLGELYDGVAISLSLTASEATSYTLVSGSLPPGLTLNTSTGAITGTIVGVTADTTYSFIVRATDAQNQDSPRTFTVNVAISDPHFSKTTLLLSGSALTTNTVLRDSSTNNFSLTAYGDTRATNFSPYGTGWSNYFNGTSYLSGDGSSGLALSIGDFTIELWVLANSFTSQPQLISFNPASTNGAYPLIYINSSGNFVYYVNNAAAITGGSVSIGVWHHVAVARSGTSTKMFLNGTQVGSTYSDTNNYLVGASRPTIGKAGFNDSSYLDGYISNLRVVKGTAVYTSNFTPPTQPLTAITNTSLLTCQSNRFLDASTNNFAITKNGDTTVTTFNPFNITNTGTSGSAYFDGTGDYCTTPGNAAFALGTGDFCLETWIYPNSISTGTFDRIMATSDYNGTGFDWTLNTASSSLYVAGTAYSISNLVIKSWNHLVYTRSGGVLRGFLNGNLAVYNASATGNVTSTGELRIGYGYSGTSYNGHISNLRIVKGSVPVAYQTSATTTNTSVFSPPTQSIAAVTGTQLLTLQYDQPHNNNTFLDASSNQFLLTRYGNATQGSFSPFSQNGWSAYFDGTGDHLQIASNAAFTLGSSADFTVECWIYPTANFAASGVPNYIVTNFSSYSSGYTNRWGLAGISTNVPAFARPGTAAAAAPAAMVFKTSLRSASFIFFFKCLP